MGSGCYGQRGAMRRGATAMSGGTTRCWQTQQRRERSGRTRRRGGGIWQAPAEVDVVWRSEGGTRTADSGGSCPGGNTQPGARVAVVPVRALPGVNYAKVLSRGDRYRPCSRRGQPSHRYMYVLYLDMLVQVITCISRVCAMPTLLSPREFGKENNNNNHHLDAVSGGRSRSIPIPLMFFETSAPPNIEDESSTRIHTSVYGLCI